MNEKSHSVLMIAFHYPPIQASSGVHRTLAFSKYLKLLNWDASVLTVTRNAYSDWRETNEKLIPDHVDVIRAFALDTHRHLSIKGRYLGLLALPDNWANWTVSAVIKGYIHIRKEKPDILFSTYPIATAHLIGYLLHRLTGLPWVADFRDPMLQESFPRGEKLRKVFGWIERKTLGHASKLIFTTSGAIESYRKNYPEIPSERYVLIENGYDEENFQLLEKSKIDRDEHRNKPLTLLHSGLIYESERDPRQLFLALSRLKLDGYIDKKKFKIILRASGNEEYFNELLKSNDIKDIVRLEPSLDYQSALIEMLEADGLLLLQASSCNRQIPAKAYEYLRCHKPIIALTDKTGDTAKMLSRSGIKSMASLDSGKDIYELIKDFVTTRDHSNYMYTDHRFVESLSRKGRTNILAEVFDEVASTHKD